jgi:L-ascorbate metabolism protein UlaG (beta-lactamase superfamily)
MNKQINIKWFPPSWIQIKCKTHIIYIDPAYLKTNFAHYPKRIEYSKWPEPIDGLPEELEQVDIILITHHHKDHCKELQLVGSRMIKQKYSLPGNAPWSWARISP